MSILGTKKEDTPSPSNFPKFMMLQSATKERVNMTYTGFNRSGKESHCSPEGSETLVYDL